jgi:GDP-L-fucose synthase
MMHTASRILVLGANGMVGGALMRVLATRGHVNVFGSTRADADLTSATATLALFEEVRPEIVVVAAARVGGIHANATYPVDFLNDNLAIELNALATAHACGVRKLAFLGSSCIYPKLCNQPIRESYLLTGPLEPTNEWYAIAKIAGIKLCQAYRQQYGCNFISLLPTNLYGYGDNFHPDNSHVIPGLIRRFHAARLAESTSVVCWGNGTARREFLFADDLADAVIYALHHYDDDAPLNIGYGKDIAIRELAGLVAAVTGYAGTLEWDHTKADGTPQKLLDTSRLEDLGWSPHTTLHDGLTLTYQWFLKHQDDARL